MPTRILFSPPESGGYTSHYCLWSGRGLMISMGGSASHNSRSAKAVCALNMMEFCCSYGRDITSQQEKKRKRLDPWRFAF